MLEECKMLLEEMDSGKKFIIHEWMWRVLEKITTVLYFVAGCDFFPSNYLFHLIGLFAIQPSCSYSLPLSQP